MKGLKSSGIVIIRYENEIPLLLLMRAYSHWDFPKGGIEKNETKLEAAIREVKEETGITNLNFHWGKTLYETEQFGKNNKIVYYFIAETNEKDVVINVNETSGIKEHEEYRWVTFEEAKSMTVFRINKVIDWVQDRVFNIYEKDKNVKLSRKKQR